MLGVDTNVLVRYLVRDDQAQFGKAQKLIKREVAAGRRVFVSQLVLLETEWLLRSRYALPKNLIMTAISGLLDAPDARFEDEPSVEEALFTWKDTTADFADCLIGARNRRLGCRATATVDAKVSRLPGFVAIRPKTASWRVPAISRRSAFFSKPAVDYAELPESRRWIGGTHFLEL